MLNHLLLYRSLTQTQKASAVLAREGIPNQIVRAPKSLSTEGCAHSVRLSQGYLHRALTALNVSNASPRRIYVTAGDGQYEEVLF